MVDSRTVWLFFFRSALAVACQVRPVPVFSITVMLQHQLFGGGVLHQSWIKIDTAQMMQKCATNSATLSYLNFKYFVPQNANGCSSDGFPVYRYAPKYKDSFAF